MDRKPYIIKDCYAYFSTFASRGHCRNSTGMNADEDGTSRTNGKTSDGDYVSQKIREKFAIPAVRSVTYSSTEDPQQGKYICCREREMMQH